MKATILHPILSLAALVAGNLWIVPSAAHAQLSGSLTILHEFTGNGQGSFPDSLMQASDGNFYGTTRATLSNGGNGAIFKITPDGVLTILHRFNYSVEGSAPEGLLQASDGNFYATNYGGAKNSGTVLRMTPTGVVTTLYTFAGTSDGDLPNGLVQGSDGNFYGTAAFGGPISTGKPLPPSNGTIFRITPGGVFSVLYSFTDSNGDGSGPGKLVTGADGNFYGLTSAGGTHGDGTLFRITPAGAYTNIYSFPGNGAADLRFTLILGSDGNFYGTGDGGDNGAGVVFRLTPSGVFTVLHSFTGFDGAVPQNALIQGSDGNFYGTTAAGGPGYSTSGGAGGGTVYRMTPDGVVTDLCTFGGDTSAAANALVEAANGSFYGVTINSYTYPFGTFFRVTADTEPSFFTRQVGLVDGAYYLAFANGNIFGYYSYLSDLHYLYHFDLGYEYIFDANDGMRGVYFYDFKSNDFFYTSPFFPFPYLYDFNLKSVVYYYPDPDNPGRYNLDGTRYFYVFSTGQVISK